MAQEYKKPIPVPDEESRPFFEGAKQRKLMIQRCLDCETYHFPFRRWCNACQGPRLEWVPASGKGEVYTFVIVHYVYHPGFAREVPYNLVTVKLDEGPLVLSNLVGCKNEEIMIGMPVEATFEDITGEITLPKFRLAGS